MITKLSIIIPHYNDSYNLLKLVKSIDFENDNEIDYEVIIVDDYSEFNHVKELEYLSRKYPDIQIIFNHLNRKSAGISRNIGLDICTGKYVLFADSDDKFVDNLSKEIRTAINKTSYDLIYFKPIVLDYLENSMNDSDYRKKFRILIDKYIKYGDPYYFEQVRLKFDAPWSKLIKRDLIEDNHLRFSDSMKHNDTLFSQKIAFYAKKIIILNNEIYIVKDNSESISHNFSIPFFLATVNVSAESINFKLNSYGKKHLQKYNPEVFYEPMVYLKKAVFKYKSIKIVRKVINIYHSENISITKSMGYFIKFNIFRWRL